MRTCISAMAPVVPDPDCPRQEGCHAPRTCAGILPPVLHPADCERLIGCHTPRTPPRPVYWSTRSATVECPEGTTGEPTTRTATASSRISQADADARALAEAQALAGAALECEPLPPAAGCCYYRASDFGFDGYSADDLPQTIEINGWTLNRDGTTYTYMDLVSPANYAIVYNDGAHWIGIIGINAVGVYDPIEDRFIFNNTGYYQSECLGNLTFTGTPGELIPNAFLQGPGEPAVLFTNTDIYSGGLSYNFVDAVWGMWFYFVASTAGWTLVEDTVTGWVLPEGRESTKACVRFVVFCNNAEGGIGSTQVIGMTERSLLSEGEYAALAAPYREGAANATTIVAIKFYGSRIAVAAPGSRDFQPSSDHYKIYRKD